MHLVCIIENNDDFMNAKATGRMLVNFAFVQGFIITLIVLSLEFNCLVLPSDSMLIIVDWETTSR